MSLDLGARPIPIRRPRPKPVEREAARRRRGGASSLGRALWPAFLLLATAGLLLGLRPDAEGAARTIDQTAAARPRTASPAHAQTAPPAGSPDRLWVVAPGETLWTIARQLAPEGDPRPAVDALRQANGLPSAVLRVGQVLVVPPELLR